MAIIRRALGSNAEFNETLKASQNEELFTSGTAFTYAGMGAIKSPADLKDREVLAVLRGNADTYLLGVNVDKEGRPSDKYTDIAPWPMYLTNQDNPDKKSHWVINGGVDLQMRATKLPESYLDDIKRVNIHLNRNPAKDAYGNYTNSTNRVNGFENGSDNIISEKMGANGAAKKSFVTQMYNLVMQDLKDGTGKVNMQYNKSVDAATGETTYTAYDRNNLDANGKPLKVMLTQAELDTYENKVNDLFEARAKNDKATTAKLQKELLDMPRPDIQLYVPLQGDMVLGVDTFAKNSSSEYAKYKNDPNHFVDQAAAKAGTGNPSKYTILRPQTMRLGEAVTDEEVELQNKYAYIKSEVRALGAEAESTVATETKESVAPKRGKGAKAKATEGFNLPTVDEAVADGDELEA